MKNSLAGQLGALIIAASLVTSTSVASVPLGQQQGGRQSSSQPGGAQQGGTPPTQQPSSAPSSGTTSPGTTTPGTDSPGTGASGAQQQGPVQQADQPVEQPADPNVKAGSRADVSAIGNRSSVGHGLNFYSLEHEIALGKQLSAEVERQAKFINDPVVTEYVNRVGQNLVRNSDAQVPFTIKVIDSDEINAMALPGGFFYVNSGLVLAADEEAELAGVMAHETAHVCAHHAAREMTRANYAQLGTIPLIFIGGWAGYGIYEAANLAIPLTFLEFSREFEAQADYLGLEYMYRAGYDPQAFVTFFEKIQDLEKHKPGAVARAFSDHPQTPDRIAHSQEEIAKILPPRDEYLVTTSEFDEVKARLARIENKRKLTDGKNGGKPTLRRVSTTTADPNNPSNSTDDDRPTLHRRDDSGSNSGGTTGGSSGGGTTTGGSSTPSSNYTPGSMD